MQPWKQQEDSVVQEIRDNTRQAIQIVVVIVGMDTGSHATVATAQHNLLFQGTPSHFGWVHAWNIEGQDSAAMLGIVWQSGSDAKLLQSLV